MAIRYLRTQEARLLMYQSGDTISPGSSHAMLASVSIDNPPPSFTGQTYHLDNGSRIVVTTNFDADTNRVTITAVFYSSGGEEKIRYSQTATLGHYQYGDLNAYAICMQWFERDGQIYVGFNYFAYSWVESGNTGYAPSSWITVPNERGMYNNPTNNYVGVDVYGEGAITDVGPNPYSPGGTTGPGGADGTYTIVDDNIDFPTLPTFGALNAGFVSIWTPDEKQVQDLAGYMWTTDIFTSAFWKNLVQNPLELIFGLSIMPIQRGTNDEYVRLGWINTGLKMYYRDNQYYEVDCGSIDMQEYWGAFFDYSPYTKISIYLPYIGVKDLDTNDLMGRLVSLKYIIDLATGTCVAMIKCDDSVYYHFSGVCAVQIPVTAVQMQEVVKGAVTAAVGVAAVATAPALAASAAGAVAAQVGGAASAISGVYQHATGKDVARSGSFTGNAGFMSVQKPYLIISRPRQAMPEDQQVYTGFPSFMTKKLNDVSGYTEVQMIHLHNLSCTDDERAEIDELLKEGVIF